MQLYHLPFCIPLSSPDCSIQAAATFHATMAKSLHLAVPVHRFGTIFSINMGSTWKQKAQRTDPCNLFSPSSYYRWNTTKLLELPHPYRSRKKKESCAQLASGKVSKSKLTRTCEHSQSLAAPLAVPNEGSCHRVHFRHIHRQFWHGFGLPLQ